MPVILVLSIAALYPVIIRGQAGAKKTVSENKAVSSDAVSTDIIVTDGETDTTVPGSSGDGEDAGVSGNSVSGNSVSGNTVDDEDTKIKKEIFLERPIVTALAKNDFSVRLTWDKVKKADHYLVYRSRIKDGRYKCIGVVEQKKFIDTDVKRSATYYYVVCAVKTDAETGDVLAQSRFSKIVHVNIYMNPPKVTVAETTASHVTIKFTRSKNTQVCNIYRSASPDGEFYKIGSTVDKTYTDKKVESNSTYYYKVLGKCINNDGRTVWSLQSNIVQADTKTVYDKNVYVGDSIIHGFIDYGFVTSSSKDEKVIAKVGVGTKTFYESELMDELKNVGTSRVIILLGINSLWSESDIPGILKYYKLIVGDLKKSCPDADIVCLSLAPTTSGSKIKNSNVNKFNVALEEMAEECGVSYYDFTDVMKDSKGYLDESRAGYDGIHWSKSTYDDVVDLLRKYGK